MIKFADSHACFDLGWVADRDGAKVLVVMRDPFPHGEGEETSVSVIDWKPLSCLGNP